MTEILVGIGSLVGIVLWLILRSPPVSGDGSGGRGSGGSSSRLDLVDEMVLHDEVNSPDDLDLLE